MNANSKIIGRLAPSPTGFLHLGNAWSFFLAWLGARSRAGGLVLRMEVIDPVRSRPEYATAIMEDLQWLGLDWDGEAYAQSQRLNLYERAIAGFDARGLVYPCYCTRKELRELASAPHLASPGNGEGGAGDLGAPYSGACRNLSQTDRARLEAQGRKPCDVPGARGQPAGQHIRAVIAFDHVPHRVESSGFGQSIILKAPLDTAPPFRVP